MQKSAAGEWKLLPKDVQEALLFSSKGSIRLLRLIERLTESLSKCSAAESPMLLKHLKSMSLEAWEGNPFSSTACEILAQIDGYLRFLPDDIKRYVNIVVKSEDSGNLVEKYNELSRKNLAQAAEFLVRECEGAKNNFFPLALAYKHAFDHEEFTWLEKLFSKNLNIPKFSKFSVLGDLCLVQGKYKEAFKIYHKVVQELSSPLVQEKMSQCLKKLGDRDGAIKLMEEAFAKKSWDLSLAKTLYAMKKTFDIGRGQPEGQGALLLYTWNHANDLDISLNALAESEHGQWPIIILNNGSTDNTDAVIKKWEDVFKEQMQRIDLPVNIGAPAARNWLLSTKKVREAEWLVYLDDDASLPEKWLGHFANSMKEFPEAGIYGCKVADLSRPWHLQMTDIYVESDLLQGVNTSVKGTCDSKQEELVTSNTSFFDAGEYDYISPCVSVTGCCHLIRKKNIDLVGGFDISYSPSQFDDLDRDLRSMQKNELCIYNGNLKVLHAKISGTVKTKSQEANINGNNLKFSTMHAPESLRLIRQTNLMNMEKYVAKVLKYLFNS